MGKKRYCKPLVVMKEIKRNGKAFLLREERSYWESVAKDIGSLLLSLDRINRHTIESGQITWDCEELKIKITAQLIGEGWEILRGVRPISNKPYYIITPPKDRS